jgi:hypothetical protein
MRQQQTGWMILAAATSWSPKKQNSLATTTTPWITEQEKATEKTDRKTDSK